MSGLARHVLIQPFDENIPDFEGQAEDDIVGICRPRIGNAGKQLLDLHIVQRGDDGRDHRPGRNAGVREKPDRLHPPRRCGGARLQCTGELCIKRCHRKRDANEIAFRQRGENVDIAYDPR